jgi:hypothetical protein
LRISRQFGKSAKLTIKFPEKSILISKSAELYADFIFVDGDLKNAPKTRSRPAKNYAKI